MKKRIVRCALLYAFLCFLVGSAYPVLDEESYLFIAKQLAIARPYDWSLPWPPYGDSYRYAHPPLFLFWIRLVSTIVGDHVLWIKLVAGLPFQLLLGGVMGWFCSSQHVLQSDCTEETDTRDRLRSYWLWLCSPIVLLVGARAAMPDLMYAALGCLSMAIFCGTKSWKGRFLCGVFLGMACWTKYPAFLLWIPILYASSWRSWIAIAFGFLCTWGCAEIWLWSIYERWHLAVVLSTADHVERGELSGRTIGFMMRLLIACPMLLLVWFRFRSKRMILLALGIASVSSFFVPPLSTLETVVAIFWITLSLSAVIWCVRKLDFFALWLIVVLVGVCATHNFSSPRYLILGMIPLSIVVERNIRTISNIWIYPVLGLTLMISLLIGYSEHMHAHHTIKVFAQLPKDMTGMYSGEWTFRAAARAHGLSLWKGGKGMVLQPRQAVGGQLSSDFYVHKVYYTEEGYRFLLDRENSVGYYAETLGFWPLGWKKGPIEELRLWKTP